MGCRLADRCDGWGKEKCRTREPVVYRFVEAGVDPVNCRQHQKKDLCIPCMVRFELEAREGGYANKWDAYIGR